MLPLGYYVFTVTPWTVANQAPLAMGFSRQEYWSGFPSPPPRDFSDLGIEPASLTSPTLASGFFTPAAAKSLQSPLAPPEFVFSK